MLKFTKNENLENSKYLFDKMVFSLFKILKNQKKITN